MSETKTMEEWEKKFEEIDRSGNLFRIETGKNVISFGNNGEEIKTKFSAPDRPSIKFLVNDGKTFVTSSKRLLNEIRKFMPVSGKTLIVYRVGEKYDTMYDVTLQE